MSWAVNVIAGSLAGTQGAARTAKRDVDRKEPAKAKRARDEFDQTAEPGEVEHAEAVRSLKDNSQQEAHEDRQEHGAQERLASGGYDVTVVYTPDQPGSPPKPRGGGRVDLSG